LSKLVNGRNAVLLAFMLTLAALALLSPRVSPSSAVPEPEALILPPAQVVVPGPVLVARATPPPVPVRVPRQGRAKPARLKPSRSAVRRARHARQARQAARRGRWARTAGRDVGWPQCPRNVGIRGRHGLAQPMPGAGARFVIIGLTNGRAFTANPCLAKHLRWVRTHHVWAAAYAFATYPTRAQLRRYGGLKNAGRAAARYNIRVMQQHGFTTPHVWLDLEPSSSRPWSGRRVRNRAVVHGWVRAYRDAGYTVGFYSTTHLWREIVGHLRLGVPEWRTAGPVSPSRALRKCREKSFQGGRAVLTQWWTTHRDFDGLCSAPATSMTRYFHKW
jgi:hypothetical protein